jgi:hypothetical protein
MQTHSIASSTMGDQSASPNPIPLWSGIGEPHQMSSESNNPFEDLVGVCVAQWMNFWHNPLLPMLLVLLVILHLLLLQMLN